MPRGRTASGLTLQQRKSKARERFTQGFSNEQIAVELDIHPTTVGQYRREYEADLGAAARANPELLRDVLNNTVRALQELDMVRQRAWEEYESSRARHHFECPECGHEFDEVSGTGAQTRNQLLNTITKAQEQRGKLLGLFGVKQEFFLHVQNVRVVQETLLAFMAQHLCAVDKRKLEELLTGELAPHLGGNALPIIELEAVGG
jgi:predicted transcriptional regulator